MTHLITDRTSYNVSRRSTLSKKGWNNMSVAERAEWLGNPLDATGVNLLPYGPYYSSVVELKYTHDSITATALSNGTYLYAISIIGEASNYANKTFTLSADSITEGAQLSVYWHDDNGFEYAGAGLLNAGSVTFNTADFPNTQGRKYIALYVYVTTFTTVGVGATATFKGVMLENGSVRHPYIPYTEILPTDCTKGAYNYSDLNRVERSVGEISDLAGMGLTTKTDWTMWSVPNASDMQRYLSNIERIRERFVIAITLPSSMDNLTYETANNIETILLTAYGRLTET